MLDRSRGVSSWQAYWEAAIRSQRRGALAATLAIGAWASPCLVLAGESDPAPAATTGDSSPAQPADPSAEPAAEVKLPHSYPIDVTDQFEVLQTAKPRLISKVNSTYAVSVQLQNQTDVNIPGPVRLVLDESSVKGIKIVDADGYLTNSQGFVEFVSAEGYIPAIKKTAVKRVLISCGRTLEPAELNALTLNWTITRTRDVLKGEIDPTIVRTDDKLMLEKSYSWSDVGAGTSAVNSLANSIRQNTQMWGDEVYSVGLGESPDGELEIVVTGQRLGVADALPSSVDGFDVRLDVDTPFYAVLPGAAAAQPLRPLAEDPDGALADPKIRFTRPVPIGISISNLSDDCLSGTLGCRCTRTSDRSKVMLTNNHVIGRLNLAQPGEVIVQPSRGDNNCQSLTADQIGTFLALIPFDFSATGNNTVDAAIATVTETNVGTGTPTDPGYGNPVNVPVEAVVGMEVQKHGRTTVFTQGTVSEINSISIVSYGPFGPPFANFSECFRITPESFSAGGDSGSLIVTSPAREPTGLLFAGNTTSTLANRIQAVLSALSLTIDGEDPPPPPPTAGLISDYVWFDVNADGIQQDTELGAGNTTVELYSVGTDAADPADDVLVTSTTTSPAGIYSFPAVDPGTYYVKFIPDAAYRITTRDAGNDDTKDSDADPVTGLTANFTFTTAFEQLTDVDCGLVEKPGTAVIGDFVWNERRELDGSFDGRQNYEQGRDERGAAGVTVELLDGSGQVLATTTTNAFGFYRFEALRQGTYQVRFTSPRGRIFTAKGMPGRGGAFRDSDPEVQTGLTEIFRLEDGQVDLSRDAGLRPR